MSATIKLYKWHNFQAVDRRERKVGFSTSGVMSFTFIGEVEEAREYVLPEGFEVAESNMGTLEVYDANGTHYEISGSDGKPCLVGPGKSIILHPSH